MHSHIACLSTNLSPNTRCSVYKTHHVAKSQFLASQDAIEVMLVWEWVIVRIDLTDVTLVSDDAYKILCDPAHPDESYLVMKVI